MSIAPGRLEAAPHYGRHGKLPDYRDHQPPPANDEETAETLERITLEDLRNDDAIRWHMERNARLRDMGLAHTIAPICAPLPPKVPYAQRLEDLKALQAEKSAEYRASIPLQDVLTLPERSHQQQMAAWLEPFPIGIRWGLQRAHQKLEAHRSAARADWYLSTFHELHSSPVVDWRARDADIRDLAERHAREVAKIIPPALSQILRAIKPMRRLQLVGYQTIQTRERLAWGKVLAYVDALGLKAPAKPVGRQTYAGLLNRFSGRRWWYRTLTRHHEQGIEQMERTLGLIHAQAAYAVSNTGNAQVRYKRAKTEKLLADLDAVSDEGEVIALAKLIEKGPANPYIRFVELMTRVKGMSRLADAFGYGGWFITWTLASRYHSHYRETGARNKKWDGVTVDDARKVIQALWQQCRAIFAKEKLRVFGQRGAEPHHDGCVHWHMLLFIHPADRDRVLAIMRAKAEEEAPEEITAQNPDVRFKVVEIERDEHGALKAASYIAKYLTKNIAGAHLGKFIAKSATGDLFGKDTYEPPHADNDQGNAAEAMTARVRSWASRWRIRQFQVFGCPPIGTWRELRRMGQTVQADPTIEAARLAADAGDFKGFALAIGGWDEQRNAPAPRKQLRLKLHKQVDERLNRYGEGKPDEIKGVQVVQPFTEDLTTTLAQRDAAERRLAAREVAEWENEGGRCLRDASSYQKPRARRALRAVVTLAGKRSRRREQVTLFRQRFDAQRLTPTIAVAITRRVRWTISRRAEIGPWTRVTNCNQHGGAHGPDTGPRTGPPRENQRANR